MWGIAAGGGVTGDGLPDLCVPSQFSSDDRFAARTIHVFSYRGSGDLAAASTIRVGLEGDAGGPIHAVGDVNADGWPDVLVNTYRPGILLCLGTAGGLTPSCTALERTDSDRSAQARYGNGTGDINGDGYDDVVIPWPYASEIDVYYGGADGITMARHEVLRGANPMSQYGAGLAW